MEISINGKTASITLESEKTVGEVLSGLHDWLNGSGFFLSGLELDGKTYGSNALDNAFELPLEGISKININTSGWAELMLEALVGLKHDLEFYENLDEPGKDKCRKRWEKAVPALFLKEKSPELYDTVIKTLNGVFSVVGAITLVSERIREIEEPSREIAASMVFINDIAKRLEELPLDIQTGKDARAAETITLFSSLAEKLFRIVFIFRHFGIDIETITTPLAGRNVNLKEYIDEFNTALKELVSAYENNDTVLVGDLAEYELSPRLLCLSKILAGINLEEKQG